MQIILFVMHILTNLLYKQQIHHEFFKKLTIFTKLVYIIYISTIFNVTLINN